MFPSPAVEPHASAGAVLSGFNDERGRAVYRFETAESGAWRVWLRYGSYMPPSIGAAIDPGNPDEIERIELPNTGADVGPGCWEWAPLVEADLEAGPHELVVAGGRLRPDCFYIAPAGRKVGDRVLPRPRRPELSRLERRLAERPLAPVTPVWVRESTDYTLPAWYDGIRVACHTRLSINRLKDAPVFLQAAKHFKRMGFRQICRHVKSGGEGAWWPAEVGGVAKVGGSRNYAKEIIDNAHKADARIIGYYWHMADDRMAEQHPSWRVVDWNGNPMGFKRGTFLCLNSPAADIFEKQMLELVEMGVDGFYYDESHMAADGCWCPYCRAGFKDATGLDAPPRADPADPVWHRYIDFKNLSVERVFLQWRRALHQANPDVVMLVSGNEYPGLVSRHFTDRLLRISDSVKTEFNLAGRPGKSRVFLRDERLRPTEYDARVVLGYALCRDGADGRPPHIWTPRIKDEREALYAMAGMVTHGCVANLDVREDEIMTTEVFDKAVEVGNRVAPYLAGRRPMRWAAIHFAEDARDRYLPDEAEAWRRVLYPLFGAFKTLLRERLPMRLITDSQLEQGLLEGHRVLFLPAPKRLTDLMRQRVEEFRARGGLVVEQRRGWRWDDREGHAAAVEGFLKAIEPARPTAPVRVEGGPEYLHAIAYPSPDGAGVAVAMCNDYLWFTRDPRFITGEVGVKVEDRKAPEPVRGARVLVRRSTAPTRVFDAVTGQVLDADFVDGVAIVRVPTFDCFSVVVVE